MSYRVPLRDPANHLPARFDRVAINAMHDAYLRAKNTCNLPQEPDFVASLVKLGVQEIKQILDQIFQGSGVQITTTGVFCHQSPMVKFHHGFRFFRCELGDLLIVHTHKDQAQCIQRNALLLQAKMTAPAANSHKISASEKPQLVLYQHWPTFSYDGGHFHEQRRSVTPTQRPSGAQYLLIDSDQQFSMRVPLPNRHPMAISLAARQLYLNHSFGDVLVDFLLMSRDRCRTGRRFSGKAGAAGWSKVVWDLMTNGLKKGFTRKRTGHLPTPGGRHAGDQVMAFMSSGFTAESIVSEILGTQINRLRHSMNNDGSIPPELLIDLDIPDPESGVSIIVIETDESEVR